MECRHQSTTNRMPSTEHRSSGAHLWRSSLLVYSIFNIIPVHHVPCILGQAVPCRTMQPYMHTLLKVLSKRLKGEMHNIVWGETILENQLWGDRNHHDGTGTTGAIVQVSSSAGFCTALQHLSNRNPAILALTPLPSVSPAYHHPFPNHLVSCLVGGSVGMYVCIRTFNHQIFAVCPLWY